MAAVSLLLEKGADIKASGYVSDLTFMSRITPPPWHKHNKIILPDIVFMLSLYGCYCPICVAFRRRVVYLLLIYNVLRQ